MQLVPTRWCPGSCQQAQPNGKASRAFGGCTAAGQVQTPQSHPVLVLLSTEGL